MASVPPGPTDGVPVITNVYTLLPKHKTGTRTINTVLDAVEMSVYHAGVEVLGEEYSFGGDQQQRPDPTIEGVFVCGPRQAQGDFKEAITVGYLPKGSHKGTVMAVLNTLRPLWKAVTYHVLDRNCTHFSRAFVEALNPAFVALFPSYVLRSAKVASVVVPSALTNVVLRTVAPPPASSLVRQAHLPYQGRVPAPMSLPLLQPEAAASPASLWKSALKLSSTAFSAVGDVVDKADYQRKFPDQNPMNFKSTYRARLSYGQREEDVTLYIATDCVAFAGPPGLSLTIPMSDIAAIAPAKYIPPSAPRLPPAFELSLSIDRAAPAFFIFRHSQPEAVTPVFLVHTLSDKVEGAVGMPRDNTTETVAQTIQRYALTYAR